MQVNKIKTYGGHCYCWDKFWPGANGSVNKVTWKESDRKCKTSICDLYTIFQSTSVSPNLLLVNTAHAFRCMGLQGFFSGVSGAFIRPLSQWQMPTFFPNLNKKIPNQKVIFL